MNKTVLLSISGSSARTRQCVIVMFKFQSDQSVLLAVEPKTAKLSEWPRVPKALPVKGLLRKNSSGEVFEISDFIECYLVRRTVKNHEKESLVVRMIV